jgi:hypothetical protein
MNDKSVRMLEEAFESSINVLSVNLLRKTSGRPPLLISRLWVKNWNRYLPKLRNNPYPSSYHSVSEVG